MFGDDSAFATVAGAVGSYPDRSDPGAEAARGLPSIYAEEPRAIFRPRV